MLALIRENSEPLVKDTFSSLDRRFAAFMEQLSGGKAPELFLAAALVSRYRGEGHVCIDLAQLAGQELFGGESAIETPPLESWLAALRESPAVGTPEEYRPLILDGSRLYLYRYWDYENRVAARLREDAAWIDPALNESVLKAGLARLFPAADLHKPDRQKVAAALSVMKRFSVISGGPGTGKTTTVAKILALCLEQVHETGTPLRIALCAPTGKAASRLNEAIKHEKDRLDCLGNIRDAIPSQASTIHRLLQTMSGDRSGFRPFDSFSSGFLPIDLLVIDEASMVDLSLLARLLNALRPGTRLILLGDRDQLASVEAGSVLADICGSADCGYSRWLCERLQSLTGESLQADSSPYRPVQDCTTQLLASYRFGKNSGLGTVSRLINEGDATGALNFMQGRGFHDVGCLDLPALDELPAALREKVVQGFSPYLKSSDPAEVLETLNRFRILCALREGPYGIRVVNAIAERLLAEAGLIRADGVWYRGRPILISRNDYNLRLFNGDVGIVLADPESGELRVFFKDPDGSIRKFPPLRLPEHETVYAMTVHKSQGSEFDEILFILPDRPSPLLTRELFYTAMTRARKHAEIWTRREIFEIGVNSRIQRLSGLHDALHRPDKI